MYVGNLNEQIPIMVTTSEKELIERAAKKDQRSVSSWCRLVIQERLNEFREHKVKG